MRIQNFTWQELSVTQQAAAMLKSMSGKNRKLKALTVAQQKEVTYGPPIRALKGLPEPQ